MENQKIQVLGSGCPTCKKLLETVKRIVSELSIDAEVEYITDIAKMIEMGVMTSPVLAVDGSPVLTGRGHSDDEIKTELLQALSDNKEKNGSNDTSCCDRCCGCDCQ
ncbi:TM0996/MTH895 family glutaredoxin-like protein [Candidatus Parcubacteria bacterium]|nr:TM0996/MTH895 family glutaredoxin-like protein [Candidatus Parcubacteria bacterium]